MKKIALLGATGSIGQSTAEIVRRFPDEFRLVGLAARRDAAQLARMAEEFSPEMISLADEEAAGKLKALKGPCRVSAGVQGAVAVACETGADIVVSAIVGAGGLLPTLEAIRRGKTIAVANKEALVMAGALVRQEAKAHGARLLPVDSEHSALYQCLDNRPARDVRRLILTASGGPFLRKSAQSMKDVRVADALKHPTWSMGPKITVDSATLMNKGLEVIEARWLFDTPASKIDILIHPQSIVHSLVEFVDGSMLAQMNYNDMKIPIQYALSWPDRLPNIARDLDLTQVGTLQFEKPDPGRFPAIRLAYEVAEMAPSAAAVMNAANEVAVQSFLEEKIPFSAIIPTVESVVRQHKGIQNPGLEDILAVDRWARDMAGNNLGLRQPRSFASLRMTCS